MSAHLNGNTLVWIAADRLRHLIRFDDIFYHGYGAAFIGIVVAAVYIFFICSFHSWLWSIFVVCMEVHGVLFHVMMWIYSHPTHHPVSCVQALPYFTDQNDTDCWYLRLLVRSSIRIICSIVVLSYVEVTAVVIFDTVHHTIITHMSECISLWSQRSCTVLTLTWRLQSRTLSSTGKIQININFSWLSGKETS